MGAGKKKANQPFAVAPTAVLDLPEVEQEQSDAHIPADVQNHVDSYLSAVTGMEKMAGQLPGITSYDDLHAAYKGALLNVEDAQAAGLNPSVASGLQKQAQSTVTAWAEKLDATDLSDAVNKLGVAHPHLLSDKAKIGLLDPKYDVNHPYKQKIMAKADERYQTLLAGGTHDGMTLAGLQAKEQASNWGTMPEEPSNPNAWTPTREEYDEIRDRLTANIQMIHENRFQSQPPVVEKIVDKMVTSIADEQKLLNAQASDDVPQAELDMVRASMTKALDKEQSYFLHGKSRDVGRALIANGTLNAEDASVMTGRQAIIMARKPGGEEADAFQTLAPGLKADLEVLKAKRAVMAGYMDADNALKVVAGDPDASLAALKARYEFRAAQEKHAHLFRQSLDPETVLASTGWQSGYMREHVKAWASGESVSDLRKVATGLGLDDAEHANRAQLTKYISSSVHSDSQMEQAQAQVNNALLKKQAKAGSLAAIKASSAAGQTAAGSTGAPTTAGGSPGAPSAGGPKKAAQAGSWQAQVDALKAHVNHQQESLRPIPAAMGKEEMDALPLTPSQNLNLGGAHSKSYWAGPDGTVYMAKSGGSNNAARAEAEAAASQVLRAGGLPAVPVYRRSVGGSEDAPVQPVLKGVTTMSNDMKSLSQADADAVVRMHVGAWVVGDHDLHDRNVLRTSGGGLIPIDQGQAFKNYGIDKLDVDYHPNAAYGEAPAVYNQMYQAANSGGLAAGVKIRPEAALPIIKQYESIPDEQYRAMLKPTADLGMKHGAFWEKAMRKEAAAKHKIPAAKVSKEQVADAFLDHAVARKKNLRADFAKFFNKQGHSSVGATFFNV